MSYLTLDDDLVHHLFQMKTRYLLFIFVGLSVIGMVSVLVYGVRPKPISKIGASAFENADVVVNSLFLSISEDLEQPQVLFLGIDPNDPFMHEVYNKFWAKSQKLRHPFDSALVDQNVSLAEGMNAEIFDLKKESERYLNGIKLLQQKNVRLLVVVSPAEASPRLAGSLISIARQSSPVTMSGLIFSKFPRHREQEQNLAIPCNTGEADIMGIADLGCTILQKARFLYRKHFASGTHVGLLDQMGSGEFVFMLTEEK